MKNSKWIATLPRKCCGRCEHWDTKGFRPENHTESSFVCTAKLPDGHVDLIAHWPECIEVHRRKTLCGFGQTCPCFKPRAEVTP